MLEMKSDRNQRMNDFEALTYSIDGTLRECLLRKNSSDTSLVGQIFLEKCYDLRRLKRFYEIEEFLSIARQTGKRPLIIDGGANIGLSAIYFAAQCHDAVIVAIEPEWSNFIMMVNNVRGLPVVPVPCALAATRQKCIIEDAGRDFWGFMTAVPDADSESDNLINSVTVDEIFSEHSDECFPFIVK